MVGLFVVVVYVCDHFEFSFKSKFVIFVQIGSYEALAMLFKSGADPNKHEKDGLTGQCGSSLYHDDDCCSQSCTIFTS